MINLLRFVTEKSCSKLTKILLNKDKVFLIKPLIKNNSSSARIKPPANTTSRVLLKYKKRDGIPQDYDIIYRSNLSRYIIYLYPASLALVVGGFFGMYLSFTHVEQVLDAQPLKQIRTSYDNVYEIMFCYAVYYVLNAGLFWLCARHPLRIYCNPEKNKYKMVVAHWRYPFKKVVNYTTNTIEKKYRNPWNALMQASHKINGTTYHLLQDSFRTPSHYQAMFGTKEKLSYY